MTTFRTTDWDMRNSWYSAAGELCVREHFYRVSSSLDSLFSKTFRNARTDSVLHFIVVNTGSSIAIRMYDEDLTLIQEFPVGLTTPPSDVSFSLLGQELFISSPDFATVWCILGSGMTTAIKEESVNPGTTAQPVPRGLSVAWGGRIVVSIGDGLWFSDALYARTFVPQNALDPPGGHVYGLHVISGGALALVTTDGVYALPEDASASGQFVLGVWSKLSDYSAIRWGCSTMAKGRLWGLVSSGIRMIDTQESEDFSISEKTISRTVGRRIDDSPYTASARLFLGESGPIISVPGFAYFLDQENEFGSWWSTDRIGNEISGVLVDQDGSPMFVTSAGVFILLGNSTSNESSVSAMVAGRIDGDPAESPVMRSVSFSSDSEEDFQVAIRGVTKSVSPPSVAPVIGTSTWGAVGLVYVEPPIRSRRTLWAVRGDELAIELIIKNNPSRLPKFVDIQFKGPGGRRPTQ